MYYVHLLFRLSAHNTIDFLERSDISFIQINQSHFARTGQKWIGASSESHSH